MIELNWFLGVSTAVVAALTSAITFLYTEQSKLYKESKDERKACLQQNEVLWTRLLDTENRIGKLEGQVVHADLIKEILTKLKNQDRFSE